MVFNSNSDCRALCNRAKNAPEMSLIFMFHGYQEPGYSLLDMWALQHETHSPYCTNAIACESPDRC